MLPNPGPGRGPGMPTSFVLLASPMPVVDVRLTDGQACALRPLPSADSQIFLGQCILSPHGPLTPLGACEKADLDSGGLGGA